MVKKTALELKQDKLIKKHYKKIAPKRKKQNKYGLNADNLKGQSYAVFLASKYWCVVRAMVLKRDDYKCVICKSKDRLEVHHDTYKNHFNEHRNLKDLMTLCRLCHKEHHNAQP